MDEIAPDLYLGDVDAAGNHEALQRNGVTAVLNVSRRRPERAYPSRITVRHVPLSDDMTSAYADFEYAVDALLGFLGEDGAVLVHCAAGASRSVAVAAAALAVRDDQSIDAALDRIADRRPVASPNPHLRRQAEHYAETHEGVQ